MPYDYSDLFSYKQSISLLKANHPVQWGGMYFCSYFLQSTVPAILKNITLRCLAKNICYSSGKIIDEDQKNAFDCSDFKERGIHPKTGVRTLLVWSVLHFRQCISALMMWGRDLAVKTGSLWLRSVLCHEFLRRLSLNFASSSARGAQESWSRYQGL